MVKIKCDMSVVNLNTIADKEILPGFRVKFLHSENLTLAFWKIKAGSELPDHKHIHEQITQVLDGKFELTIDGEKYLLEGGQVAMISSNTIHSAKAITDCSVMDTFSPRRVDYTQ